MTDVYDQASAVEQLERDGLLARQRADAAARERLRQQGTAPDCHDCGEPIPAARQKAAPGCTQCLACKQMDEARRKLASR